MTAILLDTHAWAWSLNAPERLGEDARAAIASADIRYVSPMSFYEIGQKVRFGKWPEMATLVPRFAELAVEQGSKIAGLSANLCLAAATMDWTHRDPFDRIIAATAVAEGAALVSADPVFDGIAGVGRPRRVW